MFLAAFIGQYVGYLLGYMCRDELDDGKKYYNLISGTCLFLLLVFNINSIRWWLFLFGIILTFFIKNEYFYFGVFEGFISLLLIFIYGLAYGTLEYNNLKKIIFNVFWVIPLFVLSFKINLLYVGMGGVTGILIHKLKNFF